MTECLDKVSLYLTTEPGGHATRHVRTDLAGRNTIGTSSMGFKVVLC